MHPILRLKRSGWTYPESGQNGVLRHDSGRTFFLYEFGTCCGIHPQARNTSSLDLCFPNLVSRSPDRWAQFWNEVDRAAGPQAQANFLRVHAFVRSAFVSVGYQGAVSLSRRNLCVYGDAPQGWRWNFPEGASAYVLGPYLKPVQDALRSVRYVSIPVDMGHPCNSRPAHLSWQSACHWDISYTQHERLHLLAAKAASGLHPPTA